MKRLLMFTHQYPYNQSEAFIESEINYLSSNFDEILIVPSNVSVERSELTRSVPQNVHILHMNDYSKKNGIKKRLTRFFGVLTDIQSIIWIFQEIKYFKPHGLKGLLKAINWISISRVLRETVMTHIKKNFTKDDEMIMYSYWQNPAALGGIMVRKSLEIPIVSRAHGGDLYRERHKPSYIPFQVNVIKNLNKLFVISSDGLKYLTNLDGDLKGKISISRLGISNNGESAKPSQDSVLRIVSCSYMVPVKRIELLIKALKNLTFQVEWRHIGSGPLEPELKQLASLLPTNVKARFLGNLTNNEVINNYTNEPADLFINVSELEGIPVSIMEAFSCHIPVIATNVGGTAELVNDKNGFLVPKDITPEELAGYIELFYNLPFNEKREKAEEAYNMWNNNYNSNKNYAEFVSKLQEMMEHSYARK